MGCCGAVIALVDEHCVGSGTNVSRQHWTGNRIPILRSLCAFLSWRYEIDKMCRVPACVSDFKEAYSVGDRTSSIFTVKINAVWGDVGGIALDVL